MQRRRAAISCLLSMFLLALTVPTMSAGARHTDYYGLYFPAGMPGTGTTCPYTWIAPSFCVKDQGSWTVLDHGRLRIRDMTLLEYAFAWDAPGGQVEPRKTGYDVVLASANLDASLSGPTWGTWMLYSFADELMFTGTFTGSFENGIPAVHYVGQGTGPYEGQHTWGDIGRVPDPWNMFGQYLEPGSLDDKS